MMRSMKYYPRKIFFRACLFITAGSLFMDSCITTYLNNSTIPSPELTQATVDETIPEEDGIPMQFILGNAKVGTSEVRDEFWIDEMAVSIRQYHECAIMGGCKLPITCSIGMLMTTSQLGVDGKIKCVRWSDAKKYCDWAGERLPTELEWHIASSKIDLHDDAWGDTSDGFRCTKSVTGVEEEWPTGGWLTASPESQGIDSSKLEKAVAEFVNLAPQPHSLLVIRHGYLVLEEYFHGYSPSIAQDVASVCKSFISILTGIAIDDGYIDSVDQVLKEFIPEQITSSMDPQVGMISIRDLLTLSSGFQWREDEPETTGSDTYLWGENGYNPWFILSRKIIHAPGSVWNYCTSCVHLLSAVLEKAIHEKPEQFAQQYLMSPLGISSSDWSWETDNLGYNTGGWGLYLTPREMAKLGYLFLKKGVWDGKHIVSSEWVHESTSTQIYINEIFKDRYGYLWMESNLQGSPVYYAAGHGGQYLVVLPTKDMVVIITQEASLNTSTDMLPFIQDWILSAITK